MSFRKITFVLTVLFAISMSCHRLAAQTTAQVSGSVTDASGALVQDAQVQMTNTDTGAVRTTTSNVKGEYSLPGLAIGPYTLQVTKTGFAKYVQTGIVLELNTNPSIMVPLKTGAVTEEVEISANTNQVETQNPSVNQVIDPQQIVDLPLNGRQATDLIALSGAAVAVTSTNTLDYQSAVSYSVAGSQPNSTNYFLDGGPHLDYRLNVGLPMPFPDALSEFSVGISALPANLGIRPGGSVNGSTKAGGNKFHGDVFEFVRNGFFDATSYQPPTTRGGTISPGTKDTLQRNQFGGTIGGPIKRDKVFFFGGYQGTMNNSTTGVNHTFVPTPAMQLGDFSALANGNPYGCTTATVKANFENPSNPQANVLNPALLNGTNNPSSAFVVKALNTLVPAVEYTPFATTGGQTFNPGNLSVQQSSNIGWYDVCGDYHYQTPSNYNYESQYVGRVDWQRTKNDTIFGSYFLAKYNLPAYYSQALGGILSDTGIGQQQQVQTASIGDTLIIGTNGINTLRLTFDRSATQRTSNPLVPTVCALGEQNVSCPVAQHNDFIYSKPGPMGWDMENEWGGTEGWGWTNGVHQFNVGFSFMHVQMNGDGTFQENPTAGFSTTLTGATDADEILGNADSFSQGNGQLSRDGLNQPSAYVQDSWKVLPRLQLTGGLRWDPFISQHNKYAMYSDFSLTAYAENQFSTVYPNAPPGMTYSGDRYFNGTSTTTNDWTAFAPRVGFVWDITGQGKMTLRGGYGIFYDTSILWNTMHNVLNAPFGETLSFTPLPVATAGTGTGGATLIPVAQQGGALNPFGPIGSNTCCNPFPTGNFPPHSFVFPNNAAYVFQNQNNKPSNSQQWDLAFQRQLTRNLLFSANYIGSKTSHVWLGLNLDPDVFLTGNNYGVAVTNPTSQTSSPCTIPYNVGTAAVPNIQQLSYAVCNQSSGTTELDSTGYKITNSQARRQLNLINPKYGTQIASLAQQFAFGDGAYNGLVVSMQQRMSHNFSVLGNFTWSRCMDDGEIAQDISGGTAIDPRYPKSSWGPCSYNRKLVANITLTATTPKMRERLVNDIVYGWNSSAIFTISSGIPYSVSGGYDSNLTGSTAYAVQVGNPQVAGPVSANTGVPGCGPNAPQFGTLGASNYIAAGSSAAAPTSVRNANYWYNPCAFEPEQTLGTFGGQIKNAYVGPANWNGLNLAVWRSFSLPEKVQLSFRAEAFNALNHPGLGNPNLTINSSTSALEEPLSSTTAAFIGTVANTYRIMQFAIKAVF